MAERSFGVRLFANITAYKAAMAEAAASTSTFSTTTQNRLTAVGKTMSSVGGKMTTRLTLPIVAAGAGATKLASDFDSSMTRIQSLVGLSASEVDSMREAVMKLSGQTAQSPQELADALFFITSAGLTGSDALDALEMSAKASAVGLGDTATIADLVTSSMNAYGADVLGAAEATDTLTMAVRLGKLEPDALAGAMGRVLPVASAMGVEFHEVGAAFAAMSRTGTDANEAATQLRGILNTILSPSSEARTAIADVGLSVDGLQSSLRDDGLLATLELLVGSMGNNVSAAEAVFGNVRALSGVMDMLGSNVDGTREIFDQMIDTLGVTDEAFVTTSETTSFKFQQAWADIQAGLIQVGEILAPVAADIAGAIGGIAQAFGDLPGPVQLAVLAMLGVVAATGPLLKVAGAVVTNLAAIQKGFILLRTAMLGHPILGFAAIAAGVATAIFAMGGRASSTAKAVDDLAESMRNAESASQGLDAWMLEMVGDSEELVAALDGAGLTVRDVTRAAQEGGAGWEAMTRRIVEAGEASGISGLELGALAASLDRLPGMIAEATGKAEAWARVTDEAGSASKHSAQATDELNVIMRAAAPAADDLADATDGAAESSAEFTKAAEAQTERLMELTEEILRGVSSAFDLEEATLSLESGYSALEDQMLENLATQTDAEKSDREKAESSRDLRQAEIDLAGQALQTAEAYAAQMGAQDGSTLSAQLQITKLGELQRQYPELRDEIQVYIDKLLAVPGTVDTTAHVSIGAALRNMDTLEARLLRLSQRSVYVPVRVQTPGGATVFDDGGYVSSPTLAVLAANRRPEAVLALDVPHRLDAVLGDPKVFGPVADSMARLSPMPQAPPAPAPVGQPSPAASDGGVHLHNHHRPVTVSDINAALRMRELSG